MDLPSIMEKAPPAVDQEITFVSENGQFKATYLLNNTPIIKLCSEGYMDFESASESQDHFEMLMTHLEVSGVPPPYFIHIKMDKINGADKKTRDFIKQRLDVLFEKNIIKTGAVVSPNVFVRTIGKVYQKLNPKLNFQYFKTSIEAEQYLLKQSGNEKISNLDEFWSNTDEKGVFYFRSYPVSYLRRSEWQYTDASVKVHVALLNNQCLLMQCIGKSNIHQISENTKISHEIFKEMNGKPLTLILDISKMEMPNVRVKKYAAEVTHQTNKLWDFRYIVAPKGLKTIYQVFKLFQPKSLENSKAVESVEEAFKNCLKKQQNRKNNEKGVISDRAELKQLSKKQLIEKIRDMQANQYRKNNLLFKSLSRITWDSSFEPKTIIVTDESDPYFDLINSINILQNDIYTMVNELKGFNRNLEKQVKERTQQLNEQNDELTKVNRDLDNFVYSVSHDLKAPLASILGLVDLMDIETDNGKKAEYNELIKKSLLKLNEFILDILHLSRNGRTAIEKDEINLKEMIEEQLDELHFIEGAHLIEKTINIKSSSHFINDKKRISILLKNLLSNAIKYNMAGYRDAYVKVEAEIDAVECRLSISDNGMGIAEEHQDKIFDIFYRATSKNTGTGIGLHLVKEIINKLNGKITMRSTLDAGTIFYVTLPNYSWDN